MRRIVGFLVVFVFSITTSLAQINTDRVLSIGKNALFFEDYVLSIQYFNQVIQVKPYLYEPFLFRGIAKVMLEDYHGAEKDCTKALTLNPYILAAYQCRGFARMRMEQIDLAIADFDKGLTINPENKQLLMNKGLAYAINKNYVKAENYFTQLIRLFPRYLPSYINRAAMYLERKDTVAALKDVNTALKKDGFYAKGYALRAMIFSQKKVYTKALVDYNEAIRLESENESYYINRALTKYFLNDWRGAMSDYDMAIDLDATNVIALFNRGLLRAKSGDSNRAVADFTSVLTKEPDNYHALYNRALLQTKLGLCENAIQDYGKVLEKYPDFVPAYYDRSKAKSKMGDKKGAEIDYMTGLTIENEHNRKLSSATRNPKKNSRTDVAKKQRDKSDKNIAKYNQLVIADKQDKTRQFYTTTYRGKVQNNKVDMTFRPLFSYSYYKLENELLSNNYYEGRFLYDEKQKALLNKLLLTNTTIVLSEQQINDCFQLIENYSLLIQKDSTNALFFLGRAIAYEITQDRTLAMSDYDKSLALDSTLMPAYLNRAHLRQRRIAYEKSKITSEGANLKLGEYDFDIQLEKEQQKKRFASLGEFKIERLKKRRFFIKTQQLKMIDEYNQVLTIDPKFYVANYNRGTIKAELCRYEEAIADFDQVIKADAGMAQAYFNRGLCYFLLGKNKKAFMDLSKAGELGVVSAYNILKRLSE